MSADFEFLLRERMERIDELTAQVDQLRHQNKKLDAEAEHLEALVKTAVQAQAQSQA